jgi:hypothetical protein
MKTHTAVTAIPEMIIILIVVACIIWVVRAVREQKRAVKDIALGQAWREVLNDPYYLERRRYEERRRVVDEARAHAVNR